MEKKELTELEKADLRASKQIMEGVSIIRNAEEGVIVAKQKYIKAWNIWTGKDLHNKAKEIYKDVVNKTDYKIYGSTFAFDESMVTTDWIKEQIKIIGISKKDIKKQLGISTSTLSAIFSNNKPLSRVMKVAFFYYINAIGQCKLSREVYERDQREFSELLNAFMQVEKENEKLKQQIQELKK